MLIFISDLHLMDRTAGKHQLEAKSFREIFKELALQAREALKGLNIEDQDLKIILLGDIFDLIRTESWFLKRHENGTVEYVNPTDRPWGTPSKKTEFIACDILNAIIRENEEILTILSCREWESLGFPIPPEVIYIPGNHDRLCNVYRSLRERVINVLSIPDVSPDQQFPTTYQNKQYGVFARHGHEWDPFNFEGDYRNPEHYSLTPIGDVIAAEIASKLPIEVGVSLRDVDLPESDKKQIIDNFRNLFDVRPLTAVIPWLSYQVKQYRSFGDQIQQRINSAFHKIGHEFTEIEFVKRWIKKHDHFWNPLDDGDKIQLLGYLLKTFNTENSQWKLLFWEKWEQTEEVWSIDKYVSGAKTDFGCLYDDFMYVLYGHTHKPVLEAMDVLKGKEQKERLYINTGTWRPTYKQSVSKNGFLSWKNITYTIIYKPGEKQDGKTIQSPTYETWTGAVK